MKIFKFKKIYDKSPILKYAAPQWFYWCVFGYSSLVMAFVSAFPCSLVNFGQWLNFIFGEHSTALERILKGYLTIQISIGSVRKIFMTYYK